MIILSEPEIRELVDADSARAAVTDAFRALHRGEATLANVISLPFVEPTGVVHVKAGHLHDDAVWTVKVSGDFYPGDGSPTRHSGLMLVLSAIDGSPVAMLVDNGYLTELCTGAAGAIAAELLAREDAETVALLGAGSQARYQLDALLRTRTIENVNVASRSPDRTQAFVREVERTYGLTSHVFESVEDAVRGADIVVTTTPFANSVAGGGLARCRGACDGRRLGRTRQARAGLTPRGERQTHPPPRSSSLRDRDGRRH